MNNIASCECNGTVNCRFNLVDIFVPREVFGNMNGFKRNSRIYVGDSIVRKTDSRLSKGKDVVVCLPGARIEHVTERE